MDGFLKKVQGAKTIEQLHPGRQDSMEKRDVEGKISLDLWMKIITGLILFAVGVGWKMLDDTKTQGNNHATAIALQQKDIETLKQQQIQNAQLFVEMRGMITRVEDQVRVSGGTMKEIANQQNQILDDLHWLKAEKYTQEQYEEFQKKQALPSKSTAQERTNSNHPSPTP